MTLCAVQALGPSSVMNARLWLFFMCVRESPWNSRRQHFHNLLPPENSRMWWKLNSTSFITRPHLLHLTQLAKLDSVSGESASSCFMLRGYILIPALASWPSLVFKLVTVAYIFQHAGDVDNNCTCVCPLTVDTDFFLCNMFLVCLTYHSTV